MACSFPVACAYFASFDYIPRLVAVILVAAGSSTRVQGMHGCRVNNSAQREKYKTRCCVLSKRGALVLVAYTLWVRTNSALLLGQLSGVR